MTHNIIQVCMHLPMHECIIYIYTMYIYMHNGFKPRQKFHQLVIVAHMTLLYFASTGVDTYNSLADDWISTLNRFRIPIVRNSSYTPKPTIKQ